MRGVRECGEGARGLREGREWAVRERERVRVVKKLWCERVWCERGTRESSVRVGRERGARVNGVRVGREKVRERRVGVGRENRNESGM